MKLKELLKEADEDEVAQVPLAAQEHLKREITGLAKEDQNWANALAVVQQAYANCDIERPTPAMRDQWKMYEDMITYAVNQLSKYQPDGNWRSVSAPNSTSAPASAL